MLKLCLTVILLGCATQINCENLPVFIWGQKTSSFLPALSQLNGDEFATLVKSQSDKDTLTVVFVESSLSVEDLSQCKLKTETCFENLRKIQDKTYLTAVEDPVKALESLYGKQKQRSILLSNEGDLSESLDGATSEKILFVYLDDVESKEDFAKHDELMSKLYESIAAKHEHVVAIYTARHPSFVYSKPLIRKTRDTEAKQETVPEQQKEQKVLTSDHVLVALSEVQIAPKDAVVKAIPASEVTLKVNETAEKTLMIITLTIASVDLDFTVELSGGTWFAKYISYDKKRYFSPDPVSAYVGRSFGCGDLRLTNGADMILIKNLQMQALFNAAEGEKLEKFADYANDCVGYFSPAIWGALFVVILLVMILSCGLTMMMDIKTMDRFDDPKGKTITINAQE